MIATLIPHLESSSLEIDENIAKAAFVEQYAAIIFIGISAVGRKGAKKKKKIRFDIFTHSSSKYLNYLSVYWELMSTVSKSGKGKQGPAESS